MARAIGEMGAHCCSRTPYLAFIKPIYSQLSRVQQRKNKDAPKLSNESEDIVCQNPKCHRKIEEPILLNNLSTNPAEQYHACPHCFIKLDQNVENDKNMAQESVPDQAVHPSLEKVLNVISTIPQNETEEKKRKEEPPVTPPEKEEKVPSDCTHHFGYLANRPKNAPILQECLVCQKIVDCMLGLRADRKG